MADDKLFELNIIAPERVFYQGKASMIELTTSEGEVPTPAGCSGMR